MYGSGLKTTDQVIYAGDPKTTVPHFNKGFGDGTVNAKSLEVSKGMKQPSQLTGSFFRHARIGRR